MSIKMIQVESSNIAAMGYNSDTQTLAVEFKRTGQVYKYLDVPEDAWTNLINADSKGRALNTQIKGVYEFVKD